MSTGWMARANCVGMDTDTHFFPERGGVVTKEARLACSDCPVAAECLQYARDNDLLGFWGGLTENQRQKLPGGRRDYRDDTTCRNGHERSDENSKIDALGRRYCRVCLTDASSNRSAACRNGHPRTQENTKVGSTGRVRCRECLVLSSRRAYALRKAKEAANVA